MSCVIFRCGFVFLTACSVVIGRTELENCHKHAGTIVNGTCVMLNRTDLASLPGLKMLNQTLSLGYELSTDPAMNLTVPQKTVSPAEEFFK